MVDSGKRDNYLFLIKQKNETNLIKIDLYLNLKNLKMKRVCLPLNIEWGDYNTNNLHENDPYIVNDEGELIIDEEWWIAMYRHIRKS